MDNSNNMGAAILSVEIAVAICVVSSSISLGLLVAPWLGFTSLAFFALLYAVVVGTSLLRSAKVQSQDGDSLS